MENEISKIPVIAIFDIGKTNKKLFLFDEQYKIVFEQSAQLAEKVDEDGFPCEDIENLKLFVLDSLKEVFQKKEFEIKAINFSAYGASFVHINQEGKPVAPLYNYLKEYPEAFKKKFYKTYGGETTFSNATASPVLESLNSGMQLYRFKFEKSDLFNKIKCSLHFPQYLSYLISGKTYSDITSIGCHTNLWNFSKNEYHHWLKKEDILVKLAPIAASDTVVAIKYNSKNILVGVGLHDSSAALIPYLASFSEPFILLSTGTWCISLNPFNHSPLTTFELQNDCLCYMQFQGKPVKASRLFAGFEHEQQTNRIADYFNKDAAYYKTIVYDAEMIAELKKKNIFAHCVSFGERDLKDFSSATEAYHQLIFDLVNKQIKSTQLVLNGTSVKQIFVDGGFSNNSIFMNLLADSFPHMKVYAASMAQATAVGAALAIHKAWNRKPIPKNIIELKSYFK